MATQWPKKRRLLGGKFPRIDGVAKSNGTAKYSYDVNRPGMLHAVMLRCPHAHAKVTTLDTAAAEKMPGVKGVFVIADKGKELYFAGEEVLALAADTEEHAHDGVRAVKVEYEVLPFLVKEEDAQKDDKKTMSPVGPKKSRDNLVRPATRTSDKFDDGLKAAEVTHEGVYGAPTINHQCLEAHGLVAEWDKDGGLTVWASTQAVEGVAQELGRYFRGKGVDLPDTKVKCITHYMGGGFGCKFQPYIEGLAACELARKAKAPVKLMLDRASEVVVGGNRPSGYGKVTIAGKKDGTVTAYEADSYGCIGIAAGGATVTAVPYVYTHFQSKVKHGPIRLNTAIPRAMRAPGHPQSCLLTDCPLDDFAAKIGMDPMQVRLKNLPADSADAKKSEPQSWPAMRGSVYKKQIELAAKLAGWKDKWHPPGKGKGTTLKHGIGMALHTWGGTASGRMNECTVLVSSDGTVTARSSTQDLGTAQRTVTAIVVAEILGLQPTDVVVQIGESPFGRSSGSGGSTTCPSQAPAALKAANAALDDFFDKIAPKLKAKKEDLSIEAGQVKDKGSGKTYPWKMAAARLGTDTAKGEGKWIFPMTEKEPGISNGGVGGVQVAEVAVDTETGVVRCTQIVAVQDCGLIVNKLACESQVAGGVIMGLNYALFEERVMDRVTGRQVNPDMEFYKLGTIRDMPKIIVEMMDMPERGVIGIGEPPTISTHAAISNAIFNALGVRVPHTPFTPERVLAALAKGGK